MKITSRRAFVLAALCALATVIRALIAYNGGIWADEGFFLLVVGAPSWGSMFDFLRYHESHPPFFYAIMRLWIWATGGGDSAALILPIAIGVSIVPALYWSAKKLFSPEVGIIAAIFGTISAPLSEYSAQFRPYGLLPLLTLVSCTALIEALNSNARRLWIAYVASTALLVYTHNWGWLVAFGQIAAIVVSSFRATPTTKRKILASGLISWIVISATYLPWLRTAIFQLNHAGHAPFVVQSWLQVFELILVAPVAAIIEILIGTPGTATVRILSGAFIAATIAGGLVRIGILRSNDPPLDDQPTNPLSSKERSAVFTLIVIGTGTVMAAIAVSPRTDLLLPRCLAMLSPLMVLILAQWCDIKRRLYETSPSVSLKIRAAAAGVAFFVVMNLLAIGNLVLYPRSNARDVAAVVKARMTPNDLIIIAPEWYAAPFNHYFPPLTEQIDYPHVGRSGMIDFSDVQRRVANPIPVMRLRAVIADASRSGRRVWLISGRNYVRDLGGGDVTKATQYRQTWLLSIIRVQQIRAALANAYGPPDTTYFVTGRVPRYNELLPYLYSPRLLK